ncbi:tetratricopeptide repeat protein [Streptomyces sp. NBC_00391]|uniref:tetratricopeptide repeat protein n=1 Tax=Streptomyces sp. NBC_00391 TaxID=2903647 RepID=UPI002E1A99E3
MEPQEDDRTDGTNNYISGGVFLHTVIQGRDITVHLPPQVPLALSGLPEVSQAFTGRDDHLDQLLKGLVPGGTEEQKPVLVTAVSGLAGIGKTELVAQTAHRALKEPGWFPGGILFVDMAGYDPERSVSPEKALDGWLRALGMPGEHIPEGLQDRQRLYRSVLAAFAKQGRRILVIIDNAASTEQAGPLLPTDGTTATLVTSRQALTLRNARHHDLDVLDEDASAALLERELRCARDGDTRLADAPNATATIIRLCAGLPLALCIAAALLAEFPTRPAADLVEDLEVEHRRLGGLALDDRAVRASFGLSYRLLDADRARLFRLLPLNLGPDLSTEAAAHLADLGLYETKQLLLALARAHLIGPAAGWGRWRMHDLVRLFADELGHTHDGPHLRQSARTRLFTHYETTTAAADTHLGLRPQPRSSRFEDRKAALQWLDAEYANLIPTATTALALGHPTTAVSLGSSLANYLNHHRRFHDLITVTTTVLTIVCVFGDRHSEAMALNNLGVALREVRRFGKAIDTLTKAADIYRETGDRHREAMALTSLGLALQEVRRFGEAIDAHTKAVDIYRQFGDRHGEGGTLGNLGLALQEVRRFGEAIDAHTKAADLYRQLGDRHSEGKTLGNLGFALEEVRRFGEAIDFLTKAVAIYREFGDRHAEATALNNLGRALREMRRFGEAIDAHTKAVAIYREFGDRHSEAGVLTNLGVALQEVRRSGEAIDTLTKAVAIYRETGDRHAEATALNNLGGVLQLVSRFGEAIDTLTKAVAIYREFGDRHSEAMVLNNLGRTLQEVRRFGEAINTLTKAADIYRETGDRHREATVLNSLGLALREASRFGEAVAALNQAVEIYRLLTTGDESGPNPELANSLLLLAWSGLEAGQGCVLPGTLPAAEEAADLFDRLAAEDPASFTVQLQASLELLAMVLELLHRTWEAEQVRRRLTGTAPPRE